MINSLKYKKNIINIIGISALLLIPSVFVPAQNIGQIPSRDEQQIYIGDNIAVAKTQYGCVRGYIMRGIYNFRGIRYGQNTEGSNRFMPPKEPKAWNDTVPAVFYGDTAPQFVDMKYPNNNETFTFHWNTFNVSEDCLQLNVWTPAIKDGHKRPVLVWLHGGGFIFGSGYELDCYEGENLSRKGDIVFVSINHRLGPMGFTDLAGSGIDSLKHSGNVGMLDIIAALKWVHNNIAAFGGDPSNVTIMGQSGGGSKVCHALAMPSSKGLVHKAVALSGYATHAMSKTKAERIGNAIFKAAGGIKNLQNMPWKDYLLLAFNTAAKCDSTVFTNMIAAPFMPVADDLGIPSGRFFTGSNDYSINVPIIFNSTMSEFLPVRDNPSLENITWAELPSYLAKNNPQKNAEKTIAAYRKAFPEMRPVEILGLISFPRKGLIAAANIKSVQKAPVYVGWFGWNSPLFNGRMHAFHCADIPFWLYNTDLMITLTGGGKRPRSLADKMSDALLSFMRNGNPNCNSLPNWPAYKPDGGATMILNDKCEVKMAPDSEALKTAEGEFFDGNFEP